MSDIELFHEEADARGTQQVYRCSNGYGASVVRGVGTYGSEHGKFELAVLDFDGDDWDLTYDTPITDDVIGWLDRTEVDKTLAEISKLPPKDHERPGKT